jgi:AcrR family transcriptional regulator
MAEIIEASGLSAGAIYSYFASKQELVVAAARHAIGARLADVDAVATGGPIGPSAILRVIAAGFDRDGLDPGLVIQLWGEAVTDPDFLTVATAAFQSLGEAFHRHLAAWAAVEHGFDDAEADAWADEVFPAILAFGQGLIVQRALLSGFDRDRYLAAVRRLVG